MPQWAVLLTVLTGVLFAAHATAGSGTSSDACPCDAGTNRSALMELYMATQGPSWGPGANWGASGPICDWVGLSCNGTGLVMNFTGLNLDGALPDDFGAHLANLEALSWTDAKARPRPWHILPSLGFARRLQSLHLAGSFEGRLPDAWGALAQLRILRISAASLAGDLPASWANMTRLQVMEIKCAETFWILCPLPPSWGALKALTDLDLTALSLTGSLPDAWAGMGSLRRLLLSRNQLSGPLPASWAALTSLEAVHLNQNSIAGPLPPAWSSLVNLKTVEMFGNLISGPLPSSWGSLRNLETVLLYSNRITGELPASWGALQNLQSLGLSSNYLSGSVPDEWWGLSPQLLTLYQNRFNGTVPQNWTVRRGSNVAISYNEFSGPLPSFTVVDEPNVNSSFVFQADHNNFTGPIPEAWYDDRADMYADITNNQLTGTPDLCALNPYTQLGFNNFSGRPSIGCYGGNACENMRFVDFLLNNNFCGVCGLPNCSTCTESQGYTIAQGSASIAVLEVKDSAACCKACQNNTDCVAAVLVPINQSTYCHLKNTSTPLVPKPGHTVLLLAL